MNKSLVPIERPYGRYYAVQLENTKFKKTISRGSVSTIIFNWDDIVDDISSHHNNLLIQVAQSNDESSTQQVKDLVKAIITTEKIQVFDRIFGFYGENIERVGYVNTKEIASNEVKISVKWIEESTFENVLIPIFQSDKEIQVLNKRELTKIEKAVGSSIQKLYDQMPVIQDQGSDDFVYKTVIHKETLLPKDESGGKIALFYGTNRNRLQSKGDKITYGSEITNNLETGFCEVNIPKGHVQGELERPIRVIWRFPENPDKHIMVDKIQAMDIETFTSEFNILINNSPEKNALLFVHGYRNSFEDAARRTAQLAWDLPFTGLSGFFSWPSSGDYLGYGYDEATARSSFPALEDFLRKLLLNAELEHIHIIAHSMGTLVTTLSVNSLGSDATMKIHLHKIHQLILGASDIDQNEFRNNILPAFKNLGLRRTIYASDHDFALRVSSFGRRGLKRLGQIGNDIFLDSDVDTVEASNVDSDDSHGYIFESKQLLNDLFYLITKNLGPAERRLREVTKNSMSYWLFLK